MRQCITCGASKDADQFYRHPKGAGGLFPTCKECTKARARRHYHRKAKDPAWMEAERARNRERMRAKYPQRFEFVTQDAPASVKEAARAATAKAIRDGVLVRQPCEVCGSEPTHAHHDDYYEPLAVRWLCPRHHADEHWQPVEKAS